MKDYIRSFAEYVVDLEEDLQIDRSRAREVVALLVFLIVPWLIGVIWLLSFPVRAFR